jgi:hypothetical protein
MIVFVKEHIAHQHDIWYSSLAMLMFSGDTKYLIIGPHLLKPCMSAAIKNPFKTDFT